jgi:hypothetical protein
MFRVSEQIRRFATYILSRLFGKFVGNGGGAEGIGFNLCAKMVGFCYVQQRLDKLVGRPVSADIKVKSNRDVDVLAA